MFSQRTCYFRGITLVTDLCINRADSIYFELYLLEIIFLNQLIILFLIGINLIQLFYNWLIFLNQKYWNYANYDNTTKFK